jgi:hypothetical protein
MSSWVSDVSSNVASTVGRSPPIDLYRARGATPESGEIEHDESWRYEVGVPRSLLFELDGYLADLAHALGQKALWRVVYAGASGKVISARAPTRRPRRGRR